MSEERKILEAAEPPVSSARTAASGLREFAWWLDHPRLYRHIGFRLLCWRYRDAGVAIPDPRPAPQEAIDLGRELAERYGWGDRASTQAAPQPPKKVSP